MSQVNVRMILNTKIYTYRIGYIDFKALGWPEIKPNLVYCIRRYIQQ